MSDTRTTFSRIYEEWQCGDPEAQDKLIRLVYRDLHRMAKLLLRKESRASTLQPTLLADEACLKLLQLPETAWENRQHFFNAAAKKLRQLLIDHARSVQAQKRLASRSSFSLEEAKDLPLPGKTDILALHEALERFETIDPRASRVVELRFFFGATEKEIAEVLGVALITVKRDWETARLWLFEQLTTSVAPSSAED